MVTVIFEAPRQGNPIRHFFGPNAVVIVYARRSRTKSRHDRCTTWIAQRRRAMSVGEQNAPFCKSIDVGCLDIPVSAQAAYPIVHIIDANEKNVGPLGAICTEPSRKHQGCSSQAELSEEITSINYFHFVPLIRRSTPDISIALTSSSHTCR